MKERGFCPAPKVPFASGKMMKLPLSLQCFSKANAKVLALSKRQRSLDILDSAITKSLTSLRNEELRGSNASKPFPSVTTAEPMRSCVKLYDIDFLTPRCLWR